MLRNKIVKQALQQGFTSRSRWLLQILGLSTPVPCDVILIDTQQTFSYTFSLRKFLTPIEVSAFHENRIYSR
jgi:hypothetical protein